MSYPVKLNIDYSDRSDRVSVLLRIFLIIPILFIIIFIAGIGNSNTDNVQNDYWAYGGGFIFLPTLLMILFRQKYPQWWFDWNLNLLKFVLRFGSYALLLTDKYPSTDEDQGVHLEIAYPDVKKDLNPYLVLIKWFLAIPHFLIIFVLLSIVIVMTLVVWLLILFTGQYPKQLFDFVVGVLRWDVRAFCYAILLTTDEYPPFTLEEA